MTHASDFTYLLDAFERAHANLTAALHRGKCPPAILDAYDTTRKALIAEHAKWLDREALANSDLGD